MSFTHKMYPQDIKGKFRAIKDKVLILLLAIYYITPWLRWDRGEIAPNQAILVNLPSRKVYLFNIEIWPEELYYLVGLLIIAALGLFLFTTLFGRLWCGYTCPHTVYVDVFFKIESWIQGDRNARMKLDSQPMDKEKFIKKLITHILWVLVSFSVAFTWVCYFYDSPTLLKDFLKFKVNFSGTMWILGLTASTYFFAGFVRSNVCIHICPYGRFQSAMIDRDTTIVTYHDWRGEPRMKLKDSLNHKSPGDCIDCDKCVAVCPMDIDIRNGAMQLECIGCGLCIDACNSVMDKIGRPQDLISYDSLNSVDAKKNNKLFKRAVIKLKTIIFSMVFAATIALMLFSLTNRLEFGVSITRPRGQLYTIVPDGSVRNTFQISIENRTFRDQEFQIFIEDLSDYKLKLQSLGLSYQTEFTVKIKAEDEFESKVFVIMPKEFINSPPQNFYFKVVNLSDNSSLTKRNIFISK